MTNKFNKIVSALVLCGATTFASASTLQIDPNKDGNVTGFFDSITAFEISPISAYFDLDEDGLKTGDLVFDSAYGQQFSALNSTTEHQAFNLAPEGWTLFSDYEFYGAAIVNDGSVDSNGDGFADADINKDGLIGIVWVDSNGNAASQKLINSGLDLGSLGYSSQDEGALYVGGNADGILDDGEELAAQFTGGYINVFLDAPYTNTSTDDYGNYAGIGDRDTSEHELVMHFDVTGSALEDVSLQVFSELTMLVDDFLYSDQAGGDIYDYMNESTQNKAFGTFFSELNNLSNTPEVDGTYVISDFQNTVLNNISETTDINYNNNDLTIRTRTTAIESANLKVDVPEPGSIALFGLALIGFAGAARRKFS